MLGLVRPSYTFQVQIEIIELINPSKGCFAWRTANAGRALA